MSMFRAAGFCPDAVKAYIQVNLSYQKKRFFLEKCGTLCYVKRKILSGRCIRIDKP